jgi:hypothetical protein
MQYVGATSGTLENRCKQHVNDALKNRSKRVFHQAIREHGIQNFVWEEVYTEIPEDKLAEYERLAIREHKTKQPYGYNLSNGGEGVGSLGVPYNAPNSVTWKISSRKFNRTYPDTDLYTRVKKLTVQGRECYVISRIAVDKKIGTRSEIVSQETPSIEFLPSGKKIPLNQDLSPKKSYWVEYRDKSISILEKAFTVVAFNGWGYDQSSPNPVPIFSAEE